MAKISEKNLAFRFEKFIALNSLIKRGDKVLVACSGGLDSICLSYLLFEIVKKYNLRLILAHFNHQLRGQEGDKDEKLVKKIAEKFGLQFIAGSAKMGEVKSEESARILRYRFLEQARGEVGADLIATAHNKNDLAETLLLNLVRGVGIGGLRGIPVKRGVIIRPLLFAQRQEILNYLEKNKIKYRIDLSNRSLIYRRNIMRHKVLPELLKINPRLLDALERTALLADMTAKYISSSALLALDGIGKNVSGKIILEQKKFASLSPAIKYEIIRILAEKYATKIDLKLETVAEVVSMLDKNIGKKEKIIAGKLKIELKAGKIIVSPVFGAKKGEEK